MNKNLLYRSIPKVDVLLENQAIQEMIEEEDKVTVPKLIQKTGLSRGFFYKNPEVRKAVDHALQVQAGMVWAAAVFSSSPFHNMDCKERKVSLPKGTEGRLPFSR